jgi:hypothetical protein
VIAASVRHVAPLLVVVVLAGACGRSVAATPTHGRTTAPTEKPARAAQPHAVPLVLETGVPQHAPKVELVARRGSRQIVQAGVEWTRDWTIGAVKDQMTRDYPVPWPSVSGIGRDDVVTLALDTPIVPDWVVVKAYAKLVTGDLIPEAIPIAQYGCVRLDTPRCTFERTTSGLRITGLGRSILAAPYLVAFCMWHVPLAMQKAKTSPRYEVASSWLFHIDGTEQPTILQPVPQQ